MASKKSSALDRKIDALPEDVRDRVLERAAILWEAGASDEDANRLAFEQEVGSPGVARASVRAPASKKKSASK